MTEEIMSQAAAAERAWRWAKTAEAYMIAADYESAGEARDMARTWTAVAGQFEFVTQVATTEHTVGCDHTHREPDPTSEALWMCADCGARAWPHEVEPETQRIVDERLRILPTLAAMRADETVVIDERPYPGRAT